MQSTVHSILEHERSRERDLEVPCQNHSKTNLPSSRGIKVLEAKNLFLVHSSSCSNNILSKIHYV